jgi:hypothetical protein
MKRKCFLSKCRYLDGVKCKKLIWYQVNAKEQMPQWPEQTQKVFNYGHLIGEKAKELYPDGVETSQGLAFGEHISESLKLLTYRVPVFEGGYMYDNCYARSDILSPAGNEQWDLIEVKCNTSVHEVNVMDAAWQKFCHESAGIAINRCFIMHVKPGIYVNNHTSPEMIFSKVDVTSRLTKRLEDIIKNVQAIRLACAKDTPPEIQPGIQCDQPYPCIMKSLCGSLDQTCIQA